MDNYEKLLEGALKKLPDKKDSGERFEFPKIDVFIQGNQTIIKNFSEICSKIRRDESHVLKFISRALAAPASVVNGRAIFQAKIYFKMIKTKFDVYFRDYIVCPVCKRPDTHLTKQGKFWLINCQACGAKSSVK